MDKQGKRQLAKDFSKLVDEILCYIWDPINVSVEFLPNTRSEYSMYVGKVCGAVMSGSSEDDVTKLLDSIATKEMGLESGKDRDAEVSALIFKYFEFLQDEPEMSHSILTNYKKFLPGEKL